MKQQVDTAQKEVHLEAQPDERYIPVCSRCHAQVKQIHSYHRRTVRDLNLFSARCFVTLRYRKLRCPRCGIVVEAQKASVVAIQKTGTNFITRKIM